MNRIILFLSLLCSYFLWAQPKESKLSLASKEYKNGNYQQVLTLLEREDLQKNMLAYNLVIRSQYAMIAEDYRKNIVKFDFNRLVQLRQSVEDYLSREKNEKGLSKVREIKQALSQYPAIELDFIMARSEKAQQQQLDALRNTLDHRDYAKLLDLVAEYEQDKILAPFHLEYYKLMALSKQYNKHTATSEQKVDLKKQLKTYMKTYHKKNVLYEQAKEEALRKIR